MKEVSLSKALQINGWLIFYSLIICYALYQFGVNNRLFTRELIFRSYQELLPEETITGLLQFRDRFEWAGYVLLVFSIPVKAGYAAICVNTGTLLAGYDLRFRDIFKIVLLGEFIFLLAAGIQFFWLTEVVRPETLQAARGGYPLSVLSLLSKEAVPEWLYPPLMKLNLFEAGYVILISLGLKEYLDRSFKRVFAVVFLSYEMGALLIIVLVMFLSLQVG